MVDSPISNVIKHYYPDWDAPDPNYSDWVKCLCPFHGESNPSAAISYELQGFNCMVCDVKGDVISIIRYEEGVGFLEAKRIAEELHVEGGIKLQRKSTGKSSRRVFGEQGTSDRNTNIRPRVRRQPAPWS